MKKFLHETFALLSLLLCLFLLTGCGAESNPSQEEGTTESSPIAQEIPPDNSIFHGPVRYLGNDDWVKEISLVNSSDNSTLITYHLSASYEETRAMLHSYIEAHLLDEVGLTEVMQSGFDPADAADSARAEFTYPGTTALDFSGENPEGVSLLLVLDGSVLFLRFAGEYGVIEDFLEPDTSIPAEEPVPEQSKPQTPTAKPSGDPAVLPDFLTVGEGYEVSNSTTSHWRIYVAEHTDVSAGDAYVQKLLELGYTVVYSENDPDSLGEYLLWELAHSELDAETIGEHDAHVIVECSTWRDSQELDIEFSPDITMAGEDSSSKPSPSGGGWVDCPSCYNGNCTACNGRGGKDSYSPGLPREWDECWKCDGDGDCDRCDGFGKVLG